MPTRKSDRLALYHAGLSDAEIAKRTGVKRRSVTSWRRAHKLPSIESTEAGSHLSAKQSAARMLLYQLGWSDTHIAREQRVNRTSVRGWRIARGLSVNFDIGVHEREHPRQTPQDIVRRITRAVGCKLAPDIAEEAVSEMTIALLDGALELKHVESEARKYGNRVLDRFASKFGPRSLDAEIGDADGFTLMDRLVDESSSNWLEEMGATVW